MLYRYFKIVIDVWVSWEIIALFYGISSISVSLSIYKKKTFAKDRGSNISEDKETSRTETFSQIDYFLNQNVLKINPICKFPLW
jgi:hypothetical protein